jgi:hypothetical protein
MKKLLILIVLLLVGCSNYDKNVESGVQCKYSNGNYMIKEPGDCWRCIILPGTQLAFTTSVWNEEKEEFVYSGKTEGKEGHPTRLDEVDEDYIAKTKVLMWHEVSDGNYCVFRAPAIVYLDGKPARATWTVWTKELFEAVKEKQGL